MLENISMCLKNMISLTRWPQKVCMKTFHQTECMWHSNKYPINSYKISSIDSYYCNKKQKNKLKNIANCNWFLQHITPPQQMIFRRFTYHTAMGKERTKPRRIPRFCNLKQSRFFWNPPCNKVQFRLQYFNLNSYSTHRRQKKIQKELNEL